MHGAEARGAGERCCAPRGREWTRVRDGPGRTHKTLVEADQPRLPMIVENQNRLNHLCRSRFSRHQLLQASSSFRHNKGTSGWCPAQNCSRKHSRGALWSEHLGVQLLWRPGEVGGLPWATRVWKPRSTVALASLVINPSLPRA